MFCKFHRENPKNLQRHRVRAIEKRRGSPNAYIESQPVSFETEYIAILFCKADKYSLPATAFLYLH